MRHLNDRSKRFLGRPRPAQPTSRRLTNKDRPNSRGRSLNTSAYMHGVAGTIRRAGDLNRGASENATTLPRVLRRLHLMLQTAMRDPLLTHRPLWP